MVKRSAVEAFLAELAHQADEARREAGKLIPLALKVREEAKKHQKQKKPKK